EENGVRFEAPVREGQKTGWFYDHRLNRARLAPYVEGKRVLDLFSYIGGWGVQAAARADAPGVYLDGAKIASLGLRIRNGRSFHGLALN
ncbi:class I SAM-dependent methyltransferase, partial [Streptomyces sp. CHA16]|nr:class I SAM-dependent methyltransferase [Streptomyces sp. CHA16]